MTNYKVRVKGQLDQRWSSWFEGLLLSYDEDGNTLLRGPLADDAALSGVFMKVRDLALALLLVNQVATGEGETAGAEDHR
jgi:hypothetical protein